MSAAVTSTTQPQSPVFTTTTGGKRRPVTGAKRPRDTAASSPPPSPQSPHTLAAQFTDTADDADSPTRAKRLRRIRTQAKVHRASPSLAPTADGVLLLELELSASSSTDDDTDPSARTRAAAVRRARSAAPSPVSSPESAAAADTKVKVDVDLTVSSPINLTADEDQLPSPRHMQAMVNAMRASVFVPPPPPPPPRTPAPASDAPVTSSPFRLGPVAAPPAAVASAVFPDSMPLRLAAIRDALEAGMDSKWRTTIRGTPARAATVLRDFEYHPDALAAATESVSMIVPPEPLDADATNLLLWELNSLGAHPQYARALISTGNALLSPDALVHDGVRLDHFDLLGERYAEQAVTASHHWHVPRVYALINFLKAVAAPYADIEQRVVMDKLHLAPGMLAFLIERCRASCSRDTIPLPEEYFGEFASAPALCTYLFPLGLKPSAASLTALINLKNTAALVAAAGVWHQAASASKADAEVPSDDALLALTPLQSPVPSPTATLSFASLTLL